MELLIRVQILNTFDCTSLRVNKLATVVEGNPKAPFSIFTIPRSSRGCYSFNGLLHFTLDPYLIMLSVKQGSIKYHFKSLWYDTTWDWTLVSRTIVEHSTPLILMRKSWTDIFSFKLLVEYDRLGSLNFVRPRVLKKENSEFKPAVFC